MQHYSYQGKKESNIQYPEKFWKTVVPVPVKVLFELRTEHMLKI